MIFCTPAQQGIALPAPPRERGEATVNANPPFFMEMTSHCEVLATFLKWLPGVHLLPLLNKKPRCCEVAQLRQEAKAHHQQGKTSDCRHPSPNWVNLVWQDEEKERELPLPTPSRTFPSHFPIFEICSEDTHFNPFQLIHFQALGNHHLETKNKTWDAWIEKESWEMLLQPQLPALGIEHQARNLCVF